MKIILLDPGLKHSQGHNYATDLHIAKYFKKNNIFCDTVSNTEGINFIIDNHPNLNKFYCSNDKKETLVEVFFNPSCPINYISIKKIKSFIF